MTSVENSVAKLTIRRACDMTPAGRKEVAAWLRRQAAQLIKEGPKYANRFTGHYMYLSNAEKA
jgi:hypothetical protein